MIKLNNSLRKLLKTEGEIPAQKANSPLFITGCMRSGTTFLVDNLSSHPQLLKIGSELNKAWEELTKAKMTKECNYLNALDATNEDTYQMTAYLTQNICVSKSFLRHLMRAKYKFERKMGRVFYDWENIIPVNKSTHLVNKLSYVHALFPDSKFIFIIRDIYGQSASMKAHFEKNFNSNEKYAYFPESENSCWSIYGQSEKDKSALNKARFFPPYFHVIPEMWLRLNLIAINELNKIDSSKYIVVSYEDLVTNQEESFRKIFNFLALKPNHQKAEQKIANAKIIYKNTSTQGNPLDKWKNQLTENEKEIIFNSIKRNASEYEIISNFLNVNKIS